MKTGQSKFLGIFPNFVLHTQRRENEWLAFISQYVFMFMLKFSSKKLIEECRISLVLIQGILK